MKLLPKRLSPKDLLALMLTMASVVILCLSLFTWKGGYDASDNVRKVERRLSRRFAVLEEEMEKAAMQSGDECLREGQLPADMVVYRYHNDTLRAWRGQFPLKNDDLSPRSSFQLFANPKAQYESPLAYASVVPALMNMGPKWFLVKKAEYDNITIIGGLEITDDNDSRSANKVNPKLGVSPVLSVVPLSETGGVAVTLRGDDVFKLLRSGTAAEGSVRSLLLWIAYLLFVVAALLFLHNDKTPGRFHMTFPLLLAVTLLLYFMGRKPGVLGTLFSPSLYADGGLLYSLGAVMIINMLVIVLVLCCYFVRMELLRDIKRSKHPDFALGAVAVTSVLLIGFVWAYTIYAMRSITLNSSINLELYKLGELSFYSGLVYFAFLALLMTVPLLLQMLRPALKRFTHKRFDAFSPFCRVAVAAIFAISVITVTSISGFRKEQNRQDVWANRLSVDRDIVSELHLRSLERAIERDNVISALSGVKGSEDVILNRISENYLSRFIQDYDISVVLLPDDGTSVFDNEFARRKLEDGEVISHGSHFLYTNPGGVHAVYTGVFAYYTPYSGLTHMFLELEPKANKQDKGYSSLLGISSSGKVLIPRTYDYAKYSGRDLTSLRGNFAYPTALNEDQYHMIFETPAPRFREGGYLHFINRITPEEAILISRPVISVSRYVTGMVSLALTAFLLVTSLLLTRVRKRTPSSERHYFRSRVISVLVMSLIVTLVTMASVSVFFVYQRNEHNQQAMMTDKLANIRSLVEYACRGAENIEQLSGKDFRDELERAGYLSNSDISLYTTEGRVFGSTLPEIFDREILGCRLDEDAFHNIVHEKKRYYINEDKIGSKRYNALYAPIFTSSGKMLCIMSSPYTGESYDLRMEAVQHFITILTVFLILLIIARFMTRTVVSRMFKPLELMSKKMSASDVESLEYISYDNDDEIRSIVESYNRMVDDLTRSTRQLAQAERDKAWSEMARQVAHEIKNPLTPMKLQIQRLLRLKERNAPGWEEKFDEVSAVVLDHIDILSDTANEFSTFAKLYSQEATLIDLDAMIKQELSMFDSREGIDFSYLGYEGAEVMGPKPQLTRVLVNLVTNAIQAVESRRQEEEERGETPTRGNVLIQLRNSLTPGFYDIVVEDNGYGVSPEHQAKLFTPNFTTKSSGTGLGLAICRSILDRCGATISYSTSFSLGGACFTVKYPKQLQKSGK